MKMDRWIKRLAFIVIILIVASYLPALAQEETSPTHEDAIEAYQIGAGDLLEIVVWKNTDLSGEYRVRPDGKLSIPLIGDVIALGRTTDEISIQIREKLKQFIDTPFVTTIVREALSNRVYVLGEVITPGVYPIEGSLTVLQALALAGGLTEFAHRDRIVLVRSTGNNQKNYYLNYNSILTKQGNEFNMLLKRGDTLVVK
jgi:polysaccharide export outer membrane protein